MIMMNNNLRIFIRAAKTGSFTQAANDLYISQPAISRAVKALEDELNVKLFFRDKRNGLTLTETGENILMLAEQMSDTENRIYQAAFTANNFLGGTVRAASMPVLTSVILSKVFYAFRQKYPNIDLDFIEGSSSEIRKAVEEHKADFGFLLSPFGELDSFVVFEDKMVAVSNKPFEPDVPLDMRYCGEKYILCRSGCEIMTEALGRQKIKLERPFIVQQAETIINLVKEGNGIGILSELVLNSTPNNLYRQTITPPVHMDVGIIANDLSDLTPAASVLVNMIKEVSAEYDMSRHTEQ